MEGRTLNSRALFVAMLLPLSVVGCRYAPTQCELLLDTNVEHARVNRLEVQVFRGSLSVDEVRARLAGTTRNAIDYRGRQWPVSATIVPPDGAPRSGVVTVWATMAVAASENRGATVIERLHRFSLIERQPQRGRIVFDARCNDRAEGCAALPSGVECTVSRRCLELGATCGDQGDCVGTELPVIPVATATEQDAGFAPDASAPAADVTVQRLDAAITDDAATTPDAAVEAGAPEVLRQIAPMSGSIVTTQRPTLYWANRDPMLQASVMLCRERTCTADSMVLDADGDRVRLPAALAPGAWVWRVRARRNGVVSSAVSPWWEFWVPRRDTPMDATSGSIIDVNADGFADVVVGAPLSARGGAPSAGEIQVFLGSLRGLDAAPSAVIAHDVLRANLGASVSSAGDVNGDGFTDIIAGAMFANPGGMAGAGEARIYLGGPRGLQTTPFAVLAGDVAGVRAGSAVSGGGDVNGDGYGDVVVGAPFAQNGAIYPGQATLYLGGPTGMRALRRWFGGADGARFGAALSFVGDVNADGFEDVLVAAPVAAPAAVMTTGTAALFLGSAAGPADAPSMILRGSSGDELFGLSVARAGDVNGDGRSDVIVGAPRASPGGRVGAGEARVYLSNGPMLGLSPSVVFDGAAAGDSLGSTVSGAGDVNGDGFEDVLVAAPNATYMASANAGEFRLYYGSAMGPTTVGVRALFGQVEQTLLGTGLAGVGDVNGDGYMDVGVGSPGAMAGMLVGAGATAVLSGSNEPFDLRRAYSLLGTASGDRFGFSVAR